MAAGEIRGISHERNQFETPVTLDSCADVHWNNARLRLLVLCDRPSASQEVHLFRALRRLRRAGQCALAIVSEDMAAARASDDAGWFGRLLDVLEPQILILSRFGWSGAEDAIQQTLARGLPVVTHLDDYLLEVPAELGPEKVKHHMRPERLAAISACLGLADLLYISTDTLAARIRRAGFTTPTVVSELQSCADEEEIAEPRFVEAETDQRVRIGYQGTRSHVNDLRMVAPALVRAMQARPKSTLTLFGTIQAPEELRPVASRIEVVPPASNYDDFLQRLRELKLDIGIAPLRALEFNTFRTWTKWTEYSMAGIAVAASTGNVYEPVIHGGAGVLVPDDGWTDALVGLIDSPRARREMIDRAQAQLREHFTLRGQERQVLDMLRRAGLRFTAQ